MDADAAGDVGPAGNQAPQSENSSMSSSDSHPPARGASSSAFAALPPAIIHSSASGSPSGASSPSSESCTSPDAVRVNSSFEKSRCVVGAPFDWIPARTSQRDAKTESKRIRTSKVPRLQHTAQPERDIPPAPRTPAKLDVLREAGMAIGDIDLIEVNEAFAAVVLRFMQAFDVSPDIVNVNGGAMALGHPLGATGAMLIGTVLDELERQDKQIGLATLCVASGMGAATIIERV